MSTDNQKMLTNSNCATCPAHNLANLVKLGIDMSNFDYVIALAGNPNTGKSTVFNSLTGLRQHTGNWPGKTVGRAEGAFQYADKRYKIVDLPGTYSLLSTSTDEEIARDFILFGQPDVTVIVVDASRLERNLNIVLQVLEITDRAVLCLNLIDEARRHKLRIDDRALSKKLGIPVIPAAARQGKGISELLNAIHEVATGKYICKPHRISTEIKNISNAVDELDKKITELFPYLPNTRWIALRLLEGDQSVIEAVRSGEIGNLKPAEIIGE
jgi:ferrous iron transport protein B